MILRESHAALCELVSLSSDVDVKKNRTDWFLRCSVRGSLAGHCEDMVDKCMIH